MGGGGNSTFVPLVPNLVRTSYDNGYLGPTRLGRDARSELGQGVGTENSPLAWGRPRTCPSVAGRDTPAGAPTGHSHHPRRRVHPPNAAAKGRTGPPLGPGPRAARAIRIRRSSPMQDVPAPVGHLRQPRMQALGSGDPEGSLRERMDDTNLDH